MRQFLKVDTSQTGSNPFARVTIPHRRNRPRLAFATDNVFQLGPEFFSILPHNYIGADADSHWALRVVTHRQAGHAKVSSLLLNAARISDDHRSSALQRQKFYVGQR